MAKYLILPGFEDSGPEHWQSVWEREDAAFQRVQQADWFTPKLDDWVATLQAALAAEPEPVVLVAHSLGCITVAHWVARGGDVARVKGALLVAPADIDTADVPALYDFRPIPLVPLPFPTILVASDDDPWAALERSRGFAVAWGSRMVVMSGAGHVNSDSGLGSWPEGKALLAELS